jgi:hypothetical protein
VGESERKRRAIAVAGRFTSDAGDLSVGHDRYLGDEDLETEIAKGQGAPRNVPAQDGDKTGRKGSGPKP